MLSEREIAQMGGKVVSKEEIPEGLLRFLEESGVDLGKVRIVDMSGNLSTLFEDKEFLEEVTNGEATFTEAAPEPTPAEEPKSFAELIRDHIESLNQREQDEEIEAQTEEAFVQEEGINALVLSMLALQQSVNSIHELFLSQLCEAHREQALDLVGMSLAEEQAYQITNASILSSARGYVEGRYGVKWEDAPYEIQKVVLQHYEEKFLAD